MLESGSTLFRPGKGPEDRVYLKRFRLSHELQRRTLETVKRALESRGIRYRTIFRAQKADYGPYGLIISVGGDGTFLEAARHTLRQPILGVNSDPTHSVGKFCSTDAGGFPALLSRLAAGRATLTRLPRFDLYLNGKKLPHPVLNEVLVSHRNPAAMCRYVLSVGRTREQQRSSGLWIATAAGSTAALRSAGGRPLDWRSDTRQYRPRELYLDNRTRYRLRGGAVSPGVSLKVGSLMREGMIYLDGPHHSVPFHYGDVLEIKRSQTPLNRIG